MPDTQKLTVALGDRYLIPRPADYVSPSLDARGVTIRTQDFHGDLWLAHLAPAR